MRVRARRGRCVCSFEGRSAPDSPSLAHRAATAAGHALARATVDQAPSEGTEVIMDTNAAARALLSEDPCSHNIAMPVRARAHSAQDAQGVRNEDVPPAVQPREGRHTVLIHEPHHGPQPRLCVQAATGRSAFLRHRRAGSSRPIASDRAPVDISPNHDAAAASLAWPREGERRMRRARVRGVPPRHVRDRAARLARGGRTQARAGDWDRTRDVDDRPQATASAGPGERAHVHTIEAASVVDLCERPRHEDRPGS